MHLSANDKEKIVTQMKRYKIGDYLYFSALKSDTKMNNNQIHLIIKFLIQSQIVREVFFIRIEDRLLDEEYYSFRDIPQNVYDEDTGVDYRVQFDNDVFLCFEVISNGE